MASDDKTSTRTAVYEEPLPEGLIQGRVLVIDDVNIFKELVKQTLVLHGFKGELVYAAKISEAAAKLKQSVEVNRPFDLIITDLHLPDGKGSNLSKKIRESKIFLKTPILLISTDNTKSEIIRALTECGVDNYVLKPLSADDLFEKIKVAWKKRNP